MWKYILIIVGVVLVSVTFLIPSYLGPDDLKKCGAKPDTTIAGCASANAIVTVSGGDTQARTGEAIQLYQNGWAPQLIFSGAALDPSGPSNAAAMKKQALREGVPAASIITEELSQNTEQNALNTVSIIKKDGINRIILVTSAYHQRRASIEFSKVFGPSVQIVNHPVAEDNQWSALWWMTPIGWWLAVGELVKIVVLYLGGSL
ncbi:MAG TPA: YdcF family protein [Candidatus Saccharimonadales bacterium]|jgi:uncharacterized SAM-binding protein YcdF (DUF218 family)|nr:YdcF family protein [Candidatus Saccharimonadales bacterium]